MQEIASGVFIETLYDGVNVAAILTDEGIVCIDVPSYPRDARDWVNRLARLHGRGVRYLILTDYNGDRILNTRWLGVPIIASQATADRLASYDRRYPPALLDSLTQRNPQLGRELNSGPVEQVSVSFSGRMAFHNGRHVLSLRLRPGPSAGTIWVYSPETGILFTGDSVVTGTHPPLSDILLDQWRRSLEPQRLAEINPDLIVPGRGEPCGPEAATSMNDYLQRFSSVVKQHIAAGGSRQELSGHVFEIIDYAPPHPFAPEWSMREIGLGLLRVYDQLLAAANVPLVEQ